jgi:hypothetical protein
MEFSKGGTSQRTVRKMKGIGRPLKLFREQHFTVVLLANDHFNAYASCSSILVSYYMSAIANQKFNQLYLQVYQPFQNHPEDCYEGLHQDTGA